LRPIQTNRDHSRPVKTKREKKVGKTKTEPSEIKAGEPYEDEEIKKIFNNSFANLSVSK